MASRKQVEKAFERVKIQALEAAADTLLTEINDAIPISNQGNPHMRDSHRIGRSKDGVTIRNIDPDAPEQYFQEKFHAGKPGKLLSITDQVPSGATTGEGQGSEAIYWKAYNIAREQGILTRFATRWFDFADDPKVKRRMRSVFIRTLNQGLRRQT